MFLPMNKRYKRLILADFEAAIAEHPRLSSRAILLTRLVLVDNCNQTDVVRREIESGGVITKQMVSAWVQKVYRAHLTLHGKQPPVIKGRRGRHRMTVEEKLAARLRREIVSVDKH